MYIVKGKMEGKEDGPLAVRNTQLERSPAEPLAQAITSNRVMIWLFFDRLRQPDLLEYSVYIGASKTPGFASLPHNRFAFIVCNRHAAEKNCAC